ncbi:MAG: alpha-glucosidase [Saprospiraceae bacterium]
MNNINQKSIFLLLAIAAMFAACKEEKIDDQMTSGQNKKWWKEAIVYQIYPRSFKDSNGDGIGDLRGIIDQIDYLKGLGITAIWLNPIYSSPNADNGYDVSDYRNIHQDFGDLQTFDSLLVKLHEGGIKLIMDIVVNHSSDEHEWFKQSWSSRDNPYRDYYHWWPAEKGKPAHRYSLFDPTGEAWKYDTLTNAYYLHYFADKQPDLNWENPKLRQEVYDIMKFWAEKGVDGFRLDAFQFAAKDTTFPELPGDLDTNFIKYYAMQEGIHTYLKEMYDQVLSKYDVLSVAEGAGRNFEDAHLLVDEERNELNMAYAFDAVDIAKPHGYDLVHLKSVFSKWDKEFESKGWISIFLSNHDQARLVSRYGNDSDEYRALSTKMLNTFLLSMRGTPYTYYGDELGMTNIRFNTIEEYNDISAINGYKKVMNNGGDLQKYLEVLKFGSRDNGRTPMQWTSNKNADFTTGTPWLTINPNHSYINVAEQDKDSTSILNHFRAMAQLRKSTEALVYGKYECLLPEHPKAFVYTRSMPEQSTLVMLNFSKEQVNLSFPALKRADKVLINNTNGLSYKRDSITLTPYQAIIFSLK